ncbi:MAG: hypothetical protein ACP5GD_01395 [Candidatus Micrarchaeia archaeon]|jgi:short-subunit dehydrogenase involved in D-alanine esterification of teichoic acids
MGVTYTISRQRLQRMLTLLGVSEKSIQELINELNKEHRHINVVSLAGLLEKIGLKETQTANVLRRIGIDDVTITSIMNALDEEKIKRAYGRLVELELG